jgi:hypothetical protein
VLARPLTWWLAPKIFQYVTWWGFRPFAAAGLKRSADAIRRLFLRLGRKNPQILETGYIEVGNADGAEPTSEGHRSFERLNQHLEGPALTYAGDRNRVVPLATASVAASACRRSHMGSTRRGVRSPSTANTGTGTTAGEGAAAEAAVRHRRSCAVYVHTHAVSKHRSRGG